MFLAVLFLDFLKPLPSILLSLSLSSFFLWSIILLVFLLQKELQNLDDASTDLMMLPDDDELVPYPAVFVLAA